MPLNETIYVTTPEINLTTNDIFSSIDWVYSFIETIYLYDISVIYLNIYTIFFTLSNELFINLLWFFLINNLNTNLFFSIIIDQLNLVTIINSNFSSIWYNNFLISNNTIYLYILHPELLILNNQETSNVSYYLSEFIELLNENTIFEIITSPIMLFPQFLFIIYMSLIFLTFYFTYFSTSTNEESTIDNDYLVSSLTIEAEKEITAFDDMILGGVVLVYIFGWYFYIHCWSVVSTLPEIAFLFYLFPWLYFIIFGIPTALLYDFGIYFLTYLRGASNSTLVSYELLMDYIVILTFYTRIGIQGVRLILMSHVIAEIHEYIVVFSIPQNAFICPDYFWNELTNVSFTLSSMSYFFLTVFPGQLIYWIYLILHTFFVTTVQFVAFFAIVFWLFLFLYTFFIGEQQEKYFYYLRLKYLNN